uniref:Uncharacterized protein n=1 Tax=Solanum lycopersicum TaxID=4081 RepID=A0A3Q7J0G9_SOLLC
MFRREILIRINPFVDSLWMQID